VGRARHRTPRDPSSGDLVGPDRHGRLALRIAAVGVAAGVFLSLAACGSSSASGGTTTTTTTGAPAVRSFVLGGTQGVYLMQWRGTSDVVGVLEGVLGPQTTSDGQSHDYVYRLTGTIKGSRLSYQLVPMTPDAPAMGSVYSATVSPRSVTLSAPLDGVSGREMDRATQREFDTLVRAHEEAWGRDG
jgi:hypothetical protein